MKDYYAILGLRPDASLEEIKRAYRVRAREAHPDRFSHKGDAAEDAATAMMADLNEAYAILSDTEQKQQRAASGEGPTSPPRKRFLEESMEQRTVTRAAVQPIEQSSHR